MNPVNLVLNRLVGRFFQSNSQFIKESAQLRREFVNLETKTQFTNSKSLDLAFVMELLGKKTEENPFSILFNKKENKVHFTRENREEKEIGEENYLFSEILLSPTPKIEFPVVGGLLEQAILSSKGGGIGIFKRIDQQSRFEEEITKKQQLLEEFAPAKSDMNSVVRSFLSPNLPSEQLDEYNDQKIISIGLAEKVAILEIENDSTLEIEGIKEKAKSIENPSLFDYLTDQVLLALCPELKTPLGALRRLKKSFIADQEPNLYPCSEDLFFFKADLYHDQYSRALNLFGDSYVSEEKIWKKLAKEFESTAIKCRRKYIDRKNKN
jgi:hypothetical protein